MTMAPSVSVIVPDDPDDPEVPDDPDVPDVPDDPDVPDVPDDPDVPVSANATIGATVVVVVVVAGNKVGQSRAPTEPIAIPTGNAIISSCRFLDFKIDGWSTESENINY